LIVNNNPQRHLPSCPYTTIPSTPSPKQRHRRFRHPFPSKDTIPYCVGIAQNLTTQVLTLRNKQMCEDSGWQTLWTLTAFANKGQASCRLPLHRVHQDLVYTDRSMIH
jgi:hypothetical protein